MIACEACSLGPCWGKNQKCDGLEEELNEMAGETTDWYPQRVCRGDGDISIELAERDELKMKKYLDDQVEAENWGIPSDKTRGVPVCRRIKLSPF
jgi:hypothetical protein